MTNKHIELPALRKVTAYMCDMRGMFLDFDDGTRQFYELDIDHEIEDDCPLPLAAHEQAWVVGEPVAWREALQFYADPGDYKAPFTGGMGKLWHDCGETARKALAAPVAQPATEQALASSDPEGHRQAIADHEAEQAEALGKGIVAIASGRADGPITQPTASNAGEREAFEKWAQKTFYPRDATVIRKDFKAFNVDPVTGERGYWGPGMNHAWRAWHARSLRAALASKPPAGEQKPKFWVIELRNKDDATAIWRSPYLLESLKAAEIDKAAIEAGPPTVSSWLEYVIVALYTAPHPEPVAPPAREVLSERAFSEWLNANRNRDVSSIFHDTVAHYAAALSAQIEPVGRKPLTDEQIDEIIKEHTGGFIGGMHFVHLARAVEAALSATTPAPAGQIEQDAADYKWLVTVLVSGDDAPAALERAFEHFGPDHIPTYDEFTAAIRAARTRGNGVEPS